jgi:hypothetical protein
LVLYGFNGKCTLSNDVARFFVGPQALEGRVPQRTVIGPFGERHFGY